MWDINKQSVSEGVPPDTATGHEQSVDKKVNWVLWLSVWDDLDWLGKIKCINHREGYTHLWYNDGEVSVWKSTCIFVELEDGRHVLVDMATYKPVSIEWHDGPIAWVWRLCELGGKNIMVLYGADHRPILVDTDTFSVTEVKVGDKWSLEGRITEFIHDVLYYGWRSFVHATIEWEDIRGYGGNKFLVDTKSLKILSLSHKHSPYLIRTMYDQGNDTVAVTHVHGYKLWLQKGTLNVVYWEWSRWRE